MAFLALVGKELKGGVASLVLFFPSEFCTWIRYWSFLVCAPKLLRQLVSSFLCMAPSSSPLAELAIARQRETSKGFWGRFPGALSRFLSSVISYTLHHLPDV